MLFSPSTAHYHNSHTVGHHTIKVAVVCCCRCHTAAAKPALESPHTGAPRACDMLQLVRVHSCPFRPASTHSSRGQLCNLGACRHWRSVKNWCKTWRRHAWPLQHLSRQECFVQACACNSSLTARGLQCLVWLSPYASDLRDQSTECRVWQATAAWWPAGSLASHCAPLVLA